MHPTRIVLADDHALVRAGFLALLQSIPGVAVVGEASDGQEALRLIEETQPDVALIDISMPNLSGIEVTRQVTARWRQVKVLILSVHATQEYVLRALRAGARGYLLKTANPAELTTALETVARGESYLSPKVAQHITDFLRHAEPILAESNQLDQLTPRQRETLQLIAEGRTTREIAQQLQISVKTVESHRSQLMERLDIHDVASLVRFAIRVGLISSES